MCYKNIDVRKHGLSTNFRSRAMINIGDMINSLFLYFFGKSITLKAVKNENDHL